MVKIRKQIRNLHDTTLNGGVSRVLCKSIQ
jgi:hypothetical protein